jgi:mono/diheme cytochrome c family protein
MRKGLAIAVAFCALVTGGLVAQGMGGMGPGGPAGPASGTYTSNGQRIYFTSESSSGQPITYRWGGSFMMHPPFMACVVCHRPDGKGGEVVLAMQEFDAPDITWDDLTREHHPPYTAATVKRAITDGLDQSGGPLDDTMPRWSMAPADLNDLVDFLMTLHEDKE